MPPQLRRQKYWSDWMRFAVTVTLWSGVPTRAIPSVVVFSDVDRALADPSRPSFLKAARILARLPAQKVALGTCAPGRREQNLNSFGSGWPFPPRSFASMAARS